RGDKERTYKMKLEDGVHRATAEPLQATKMANIVHVTLSYPSGAVQGSVDDRSFTVDKQTIKLSDVRELRFSPESRVTLLDGKVLQGEIGGLNAIEVNLGTDKVSLNPARVSQMAVQPASADEGHVSVTVIVRQEGKEITRTQETLVFRDLPERLASEV